MSGPHSTTTRRKALALLRAGATRAAAAKATGAGIGTVTAWALRARVPGQRAAPRRRVPLTPEALPPTMAVRLVDSVVARLAELDAPSRPRRRRKEPPPPPPPPRVIPRSGCDHFRMGHRTLCTRCFCAVQRGEAVLG